jgi:hypothetical protein
MYFGDRSVHDTNVVTIAFTRDDTKIYFGVSYCNKGDIYNKHYGKDLARERLVTNGDDGIDIIPGVSVYDAIWNYLYYSERGQRLTYSKPSWVVDLMLIEKIIDRYNHETTRSLWEDCQQESCLDKVLKFFKLK